MTAEQAREITKTHNRYLETFLRRIEEEAKSGRYEVHLYPGWDAFNLADEYVKVKAAVRELEKDGFEIEVRPDAQLIHISWYGCKEEEGQ